MTEVKKDLNEYIKHENQRMDELEKLAEDLKFNSSWLLSEIALIALVIVGIAYFILSLVR